MTPQEMKDMARQAAQKEVDAIKQLLVAAAKNAQYSIQLPRVSDAATEILREEGYLVVNMIKYIKVGIKNEGAA